MAMIKAAKKVFTFIFRILDYPVVIILLCLCTVALPLALPWMARQRRQWQRTSKGKPNALILRGFSITKQKRRGAAHLLAFQNESLQWVGILDAANAEQFSDQIADSLFVVGLRSPPILASIAGIGFRGSSIVVREIVAVLKLTAYCLEKNIGVLRAYKHNYPALQACLVSKLLGVPFIVDISGNYELIRRLTGKAYYLKTLSRLPIVRGPAKMVANWLLGWPLRQADRVFGRNKNNYEHAFALGAPVERLSLLRITNFSEKFLSCDPERPPPGPADYPYLLYVGRLAKINYPLDVIRAFNLAAPRLPRYRLVMIGDGSIRKAVEREKERSPCGDRIELLGARSNEIVFSWTAHASVAVCPYSGSTLVEAMLCAIPVVAYDIEWHAEIVMDNYTGFLVPFGHIDILADRMVEVIQNLKASRTVAERGRELARVVFDQKKIAMTESGFYNRILESEKSR